MNINIKIPTSWSGESTRIQGRLGDIHKEVDLILNEVEAIQKTAPPKFFQLHFEGSHPDEDIISADERAQAVSFTSRYLHLPMIETLTISKGDGNHFYFEEYHELRLLLNEYRSIVNNQSDSIYYTKIHAFCQRKMRNKDVTKELAISAVMNDMDVTDILLKMLAEKLEGIKCICGKADFDFIYNGVLQHSDSRFSERLLDEMFTGQLSYTFYKNSLLCMEIKELLKMHHMIINILTFPELGSL